MEAAGHRRRLLVAVPNFAGVPAFLRGSKRLATLPSGLSASVMRGFASCALPVRVEGASFAMFMAWHRRHARDPAHALVRDLLAREAAKYRAGAMQRTPRPLNAKLSPPLHPRGPARA